MDLLQRIADKHARIGIIGLGYVGRPQTVGFARGAGSVVGDDVDQTTTAPFSI